MSRNDLYFFYLPPVRGAVQREAGPSPSCSGGMRAHSERRNQTGYRGVGRGWTKDGSEYFFARVWDKQRKQQRHLPGTHATAAAAAEQAAAAEKLMADNDELQWPSPRRNRKRRKFDSVEPSTVIVMAEDVPGGHAVSPRRVLSMMLSPTANQLPVVPAVPVSLPSLYTAPNA